MFTHFSALVYLDDVVRSLSLLNGSALSVSLATSLIVGNIYYGAALKPSDTDPRGSSIFMGASPYSGAINGSTFKKP